MWFADCSCQLKGHLYSKSLKGISSWGRSQQVWLFPGEGYCDLQVPSTVSAVYWEIISFIPCASTCITHTLAILSCMEYHLMLVRITCVSGIHVLPNILLWRLGNAQVLCHWQEGGRQRDMNGYLQTILLLCFHLYTVFVYLSEAEHTSSINRTFRECSKTLLWEQTSPCSFWRRLSSYTYPRAVSQMASATPNTSHACQT